MIIESPSGNTTADIETISGPAASAIKMKGSRLWTVVQAEEVSGKSKSLGLMLLIAKDDKERMGDPGTTKSVVTVRLPFLRQMVPSWLPPLIILAVVLVTIAGDFLGYGLTSAFNKPVLASWRDLAVATGMVLLTMAGLTLFEATAIARHVNGKTAFAGFSAGFIAVEPVVWRLGLPFEAAFYAISFAFSVVLYAFGWFLLSPPISLGLMTGAFLYLMPALYPLEAGPGSKCLETLTGSPDIPKQLKWTIISRFMAVRLSPETSSGKAMSWAAILLSCWAAFAGGALYFLTSYQFTQGSIAGVIWRTLFSIFGLGYTLWLIFRIFLMVYTASRLTEKTKLRPITPSENILAYWKNHSALMCHIPRLREASWQWASASAGSFLIKRGADDNRFYWIASGRAAVYIQDKNGDSLQVAALGSGTGVGEIALLENVKRTADVVIEQTAVVAMLDKNEFMKCTDEQDRMRFRQVITAGQALSRSPVFFGLPGSDRERWIACGKPKSHAKDEILIREGSEEKWIGLIVSGRIEVLKEGLLIAELGPDTVIGEMAYLEDKPRNATLRARENTLLWQWEPEWLDTHLDKSGLLGALTELARERGKQA